MNKNTSGSLGEHHVCEYGTEELRRWNLLVSEVVDYLGILCDDSVVPAEFIVVLPCLLMVYAHFLLL